MRKLLLIITLFLTILSFIACNPAGADVDGTSLSLTLKDELGNTVSGASVKLFASQTDWVMGTNQVSTTQFSDETGKVTFSGLSAIKYYWFAQKDAKNNYNGACTTTAAIEADVTTKLTVVLTSTGTLKFVNSSHDNYKIYINGTETATVAGNTTTYKYYSPIGFYSIRVLQMDGYLLYATDKTYTGTLAAGGTMTTTFP